MSELQDGGTIAGGGRRFGRARRSRLIASSMLGTGASALLLLAGSPARASDECGPSDGGTVTCTAAGNPYASGVTYMPANSLTVNTTSDAQIGGRVQVSGGVDSGNDITLNHAGTITSGVDGMNAVEITGNNVTVQNTGTITNTGTIISGTFDDGGNRLTPDQPADGINITAGGAVSVTNNGAISVPNGGSAGIRIVAAGDVTIGGTGTIATSSSSTGVQITSTAGGVNGSITNVDAAGGSSTVNILAQGAVTLGLDAINGGVSITNGGSDADGNPILDPSGDVALDVGTISNGGLQVQNNVGGVDVNLTGSIFGSTSLTGTGPVTATIGGTGIQNSLSLTSTTDAASAIVNAAITGDVQVTGGTSAAATIAPNISIGSLTVTASDGGTTAAATLGSNSTVNNSVSVTGITGATLDIGEGVKIGGGASLTTSGGEANIVLPANSSVGGDVSATSQGDGTAANIEVTSGATVSGGLTAQGNTTASILIDKGGVAGTGGSSGITLGSTQGAAFTNLGTFGGGNLITASGGNTIITNAGLLAGSFAITGAGNSVTNSGTIVLGDGRTGSIGDSGENSFTNTGIIQARTTGAPTFPVVNRLSGLTTFSNSGTIDLRNASGGDVIAISGTTDAPAAGFVGSGKSIVYLDLYNGRNGALADQLTVSGAITGSTTVVVGAIGGSAALTPRTVIVQGGAGTQASAITLVGPTSTALVTYSTTYDPTTNGFALIGTPGDALVHLARIDEGAQQLWYRSADTVSSHFAELRDARYGGYGAGGGRIWGTMYGQTSRRKGSIDAGAFGTSREVAADYRQDTFGGQLGFDVIGYKGEDKGFTVGVTAGYQHSKLNYAQSADNTRFNVANAGLLLGYHTGGVFLNALGKFDYYWLRGASSDAGYSDRFTGNSYGGQAELGYRFGADRFYIEPVATIAYVRTNLNETRIGDFDVDFGLFQGLRGKAGARLGSRLDLGGGATAVIYAQGNYVHEFKGDDATRFTEGLTATDIANRRLPDYGEGKIGVTAGMSSGVTGFFEGFGTAGRGYRGGGGRAGIRVRL